MAVAMYGPESAGTFTTKTVAAVMNTVGTRQTWVWFTSWASQWSPACAFLQHAPIHWLTRGVFVGKRKTHLSPQIDDLELATDLYSPNGTTFRIRPADLDGHVSWQVDLNSRLPAGSSFRLELGHNGNGDIDVVTNPTSGAGVCFPDYPVYTNDVADTALEWVKPLGTGVDAWPVEFQTCALLDPLTTWYQTSSNRDAFAHVSHTFTHLELNNATYHDAAREIQFNEAWLTQTGIASGAHFSPHGLIPPAIIGLHNGDVIQAWLNNGVTHVVGDNTRPILRNPTSVYWPAISTTVINCYDGLVISTRFATFIYYSCDTFDCDVTEWHALIGTSGTYQDMLTLSKNENTNYLFNLQANPYMFHQANMRLIDAPTYTVGPKTGRMSLVQLWVETVAQELARLTNWPIISLTHDENAQYFLDRMALDNCHPGATYTLTSDGKGISQIVVTTNGNTCSVPVPVTIPSGSASTSGGSVTADQVGSEPPIQWVTLNGSPVTLTFNPPIAI
ncbi:uncharacterized protein LOC62_08G009838 [Vanrija pseudolonga]|uniref:Uncharacterized protein n=1 Tax=Vanrija pseudolonga TaxID=143232 RepID=A0AAF0YJC2_9TREE|nr:hypothetical protein LOC62_08G009838 [Vanrija pseudolonga]